MNWFLAKMVYRITCGDGNHAAQFDEQLRLIKAVSKDEAFEKAKLIGKQEEDNFENVHQKPVRWEFINVCELYPISSLVNGAELYSRIEEKTDGDQYIEIINKKAAMLKQSSTHQILQLV
ncbi:MAG TPA: DUF4288 domain-containing protein [Chitinophagaceae bacterium]